VATGGATELAAAGTVAGSKSCGGAVHDGPRSPGTSNTASGSALSSAVAASYNSITAAIAERIAESHSARMSLSTNGFTSWSIRSLAVARSPAPVVTVCAAASHSPGARSSAAIAAATLPSTACHKLSRSVANASAVVRTAAAAAADASPWRRRNARDRSAVPPCQAEDSAASCSSCRINASSVAATAASNAAQSAFRARRSRPSSLLYQSLTCDACSVKSGFA
jgi:hypothetical protein